MIFCPGHWVLDSCTLPQRLLQHNCPIWPTIERAMQLHYGVIDISNRCWCRRERLHFCQHIGQRVSRFRLSSAALMICSRATVTIADQLANQHSLRTGGLARCCQFGLCCWYCCFRHLWRAASKPKACQLPL